MPLLLEFPKINVLLLSVPFYSLSIPPVTWLTVIINIYFLKWNDGCFLFHWKHGSNEKRTPKYPLHLYICLPIYSTLSCYCELFMLLSKANLSSYPLDHIILSNILSLLDHYPVNINRYCKKTFWFCIPFHLAQSHLSVSLDNKTFRSHPRMLSLISWLPMSFNSTWLNFFHPPSKCSENAFVKVTNDFQIPKNHWPIVNPHLTWSVILSC